MASNTNAGSLVWANYVDVNQDVKPWMQLTVGQADADIRLQLITDMVCQWAQKRIGQPIAPTQFDRRFDGWAGWNGAYIELPYSPVLEITSVVEYWGISGPHTLSEATPTNQVDGYQIDYLTGRVTRVFPGNVQKPWFPGSHNIEIAWTAGYNPVPADLKVATLEMIAHWWRNTQQSMRTNVRAGGDDAEQVAQGMWSGTPLRVVNILDTYLRVGIG